MEFSKELKKDFLDEAFELVRIFEDSLLELEKDPLNEKYVNEIFRVVHTIKGGSATLGYNEIKDFTHLLEDIFDLLRKKKIILDNSKISLLLECKDEVEKMLKSREKDEPYSSSRIEELKSSLNAIKGDSKTEVKTNLVRKDEGNLSPDKDVEYLLGEIRLSNYELSTINELISSGKKVYVIFYEFNEDYEMKEVSPFQVYALLNDISRIIKIMPDLQELESRFSKRVCFIISTEWKEEEIRNKTFMKEMVSKFSLFELRKELLEKIGEAMMKKEADKVSSEVRATKNAFEDKEREEKRAITTIRIESSKIDTLLNLVGELVITRSALSGFYDILERINSSMRLIFREFLSGVSKLNLSKDEKISDERNLLLSEILNELFSFFDNYRENVQRLVRVSSELQESVMSLRMVPIQMVFSRFPRLVRDMAEKMGKKVDLIVEGVETEIDKGMVDDIFDPLIHIIRNSLDHGIEPPEERIKKGKSETGKIVLKAFHEGNNIVIEVSDDGRGVDFEALRRKALESKILSPDVVNRMSQKELLALIFLPGFSTSSKVTEISGRGVGMDVVKKKVEELGGSVGFTTGKDRGSKVTIRLPLTLAIIQALQVEVSGINYFIPVADIDESVIISKENIKDVGGEVFFSLRENLIPLIYLGEYFYNEKISFEEIEKKYCVVVSARDKNYGFVVDEVIGEQDVVIKPMNTKFIKSRGISAATIVGNGEIGFIVDVAKVFSKV